MTENKLKWTLIRGSTGVDTLHTNFFTTDLTPNHKIIGDIIPNRGGNCSFIIKVDDEYISSGSRTDVFTAINDVEYLIEEQIRKWFPAGPINPTPIPLDGVPAPKGVVYDPNIPIRKQLKRRVDTESYALKNETIICGAYRMSIQCNEYVYCSPRENLTDPSKYESYELAIMDENSDFVGKKVLPHKHESDDVMGWVDPEELQEIAAFLCTIPAGYKSPEYNGKKNWPKE
jgi:hypothetical protein